MGQGARILSGWKLHLQKTTQKHRWSRGTTRWTRTSFPTGTLRIRGAVKSEPGQRSFVGRPANGGCCQRRASLLQSATPGPLPLATPGPLPLAHEGPLPLATTGPLPRATPGPLPRATPGPLPRVTAELLPLATTGLLPRAIAELPPRATPGPLPRVTAELPPRVTAPS